MRMQAPGTRHQASNATHTQMAANGGCAACKRAR